MDRGSQIHGWLARQPGGPANHVFSFPHPFWAYNIGIGILLDFVSSIMDGIFLFVLPLTGEGKPMLLDEEATVGNLDGRSWKPFLLSA